MFQYRAEKYLNFALIHKLSITFDEKLKAFLSIDKIDVHSNRLLLCFQMFFIENVKLFLIISAFNLKKRTHSLSLITGYNFLN